MKEPDLYTVNTDLKKIVNGLYTNSSLYTYNVYTYSIILWFRASSLWSWWHFFSETNTTVYYRVIQDKGFWTLILDTKTVNHFKLEFCRGSSQSINGACSWEALLAAILLWWQCCVIRIRGLVTYNTWSGNYYLKWPCCTKHKNLTVKLDSYLGSSWFVLPLPYNGITLSLLMPALHTGHTDLFGRVSNH